MSTLLSDPASCHYVVTSVTVYYSVVVDLSKSRSVHATEHEPCCPDPFLLSSSECRAVHYGLCSSLLKLPTFSILPSGALVASANKSNSAKVGESAAQSASSDAVTRVGIPTQFSPSEEPYSLEVLATNLEEHLKPLVTILSLNEATGVNRISTTSEVGGEENNESIGELVSKLQHHLGNFISAFKEQQSQQAANTVSENEAWRADIASYETSFRNLWSTNEEAGNYSGAERDGLVSHKANKNSFPETQMPHLWSKPHDQIMSDELKSAVSEVEREFNLLGDLMKSEAGSFLKNQKGISPSGTDRDLRPTDPHFVEMEKLVSDSVEACQCSPLQMENNQFALSPSRQTLLQEPCEMNAQKYRESTSTPHKSSTSSDDADILDSLISLMNVSLTSFDDALRSVNKKSSKEKPIKNETSTPGGIDCRQESKHLAPRVGNKMSPNNAHKGHTSDRSWSHTHHESQKSDQSKRYSKTKTSHSHTRRKLTYNNDTSSDRLRGKSHGENVMFTNYIDKLGIRNKNGIRTDISNTSRKKHSDANSAKKENADLWATSNLQHSKDSRATTAVSLPDIPHPQLTDAQRQVTRERHSYVGDYPHLLAVAKASVAERVLVFEKCPDWNIERISSSSSRGTTQPAVRKAYLRHYKEKETYHPVQSGAPQSNKSLLTTPSNSSHIPKFYFPNGQPPASENVQIQMEKIKNAFASRNGRLTKDHFRAVTKACDLPLYWKMPLYLAACSDKLNNIACDKFLDYWKRIINTYHDEASRFVQILSRGRRHFLLHEDFMPMIQDIINTHPGLMFLKDSTEFHSRYADTVISRIFYNVNSSWSGKITASELRKSNFLQIVAMLEDDDDINQMTDYFSYEHFYVIYCKFWKIDTDHDLFINKYDLKRHNMGAISTRMVDRIFSGAVTRGAIQKMGKMSYTEFVWFLISEEDKRHPRSIEYWFRCMDLNGDGYLSMYELEYFYEEQLQRMEALGIEALPFKDCLCQMLDMVRPKTSQKISLSDLKSCKMTPLFFDTFFNLQKYLEHEQRDPFSSQKEADCETQGFSDWNKFADEEYQYLVTEENGNDHPDDYSFERCTQVGTLMSAAEKASMGKSGFVQTKVTKSSIEDDDDEYDYADSDADY